MVKSISPARHLSTEREKRKTHTHIIQWSYTDYFKCASFDVLLLLSFFPTVRRSHVILNFCQWKPDSFEEDWKRPYMRNFTTLLSNANKCKLDNIHTHLGSTRIFSNFVLHSTKANDCSEMKKKKSWKIPTKISLCFSIRSLVLMLHNNTEGERTNSTKKVAENEQ